MFLKLFHDNEVYIQAKCAILDYVYNKRERGATNESMLFNEVVFSRNPSDFRGANEEHLFALPPTTRM